MAFRGGKARGDAGERARRSFAQHAQCGATWHSRSPFEFFFLITSNKSARLRPAWLVCGRKHQARGRSLYHDFIPVLYCAQLRGELRVEARPRTHTPRRRVTCHRLASATCIFIGAVFLSVAVVSSWRDSRRAGIVHSSRVLRPDVAVAKVINCHISKKRSVAERRGYEHAQQRSKENDNIKPT